MITESERIQNQANTLEQYRRKILDLQANVNSRNATIAAQQKQIDALRDALEAVRRLQNRWSHSYHIEHNRAAKELEAALLAVTPQTEGELDYPAWDGDVK